MSPEDIQQGKTYIDRLGRIYEVKEFYRRKSDTMVRFTRLNPAGVGFWKLSDFANQMKEAYRNS